MHTGHMKPTRLELAYAYAARVLAALAAWFFARANRIRARRALAAFPVGCEVVIVDLSKFHVDQCYVWTVAAYNSDVDDYRLERQRDDGTTDTCYALPEVLRRYDPRRPMPTIPVALAVLLMLGACDAPCVGVDAGGASDAAVCSGLVGERAAACGLPCPFVGSTCEPARAERCAMLLEEQGGDCANDTSILRSVDCTEACQ